MVKSFSVGTIRERYLDSKDFEPELKELQTEIIKTFDAEIDKKIAKDRKKNRQINSSVDNRNAEVVVDIDIDRQVKCISFLGYVRVGRSRRMVLQYTQIGSIILNLKGKNKQTNKNVFNVNAVYGLGNGDSSSTYKPWTCDDYNEQDAIIIKKILPLAVSEIGQQRLLTKGHTTLLYTDEKEKQKSQDKDMTNIK